jgi:hypothetical protein
VPNTSVKCVLYKPLTNNAVLRKISVWRDINLTTSMTNFSEQEGKNITKLAENTLHRMKKQYSKPQLHTTNLVRQKIYTRCWGGIGMGWLWLFLWIPHVLLHVRKKFGPNQMIGTIFIEYLLNSNPIHWNGQFGCNQWPYFFRDQIKYKQNNVAGILISSVSNYRNDFRTIWDPATVWQPFKRHPSLMHRDVSHRRTILGKTKNGRCVRGFTLHIRWVSDLFDIN